MSFLRALNATICSAGALEFRIWARIGGDDGLAIAGIYVVELQ
jgi:hypothetical protein